jgi:hypothetical protein
MEVMIEYSSARPEYGDASRTCLRGCGTGNHKPLPACVMVVRRVAMHMCEAAPGYAADLVHPWPPYAPGVLNDRVQMPRSAANRHR